MNYYSKEYLDNLAIRTRQAVLQNSMSAELGSRLADFRNFGVELREIADEYQEIVNSELFDSPYYQRKAEDLDRLFQQKQFEFMKLHENLKLIFYFPLILN